MKNTFLVTLTSRVANDDVSFAHRMIRMMYLKGAAPMPKVVFHPN